MDLSWSFGAIVIARTAVGEVC